MSNDFLVLKNVTKAFGKSVVIDDLDLTIKRGTMVTLLGPSGCGKTTILRLVAGLENPTSGQIFIDGEDVTKSSIQNRDICIVFQSYALFPHMSIGDNVGYGLRMQNVSKEERKQRVKEALELEGLKPQFKDILESYLIRSVVLSQPELSREELDVMLNELTITEPTLAKKTEQVSVALYDLTIACESNDYFETLTNEFKYPQLEIIYYQALNATIKGDTARANELLSKLVHEDEELYVVRMAKVLLNGTVER